MKTTGSNTTITINISVDEEQLGRVLAIIVDKMLEESLRKQDGLVGAPEATAVPSPTYTDEEIEAAVNEHYLEFLRDIKGARPDSD